ncbi:calcium-translocating P-type ATPase, PMCA-type [Vagococcus entomophilus]|uniref:P-type Ca(2+) transporter n=1 Tax=Vagococcus entomophilus TaxID=1160095 RepID=A0A430AGR5_9ENTE|nr:calcium-translocating P-type ATPase, PMCA-type [Vagococcus entomophilus]RSU07037.1 calcium-translocating P-type ATPase, PMCA-type [Vagococcus entomophilus]
MKIYQEKVGAVIARLKINIESGLNLEEVQKKQKQEGMNRFDEAKKESIFKKFIHHLTDVTTIILMVAAIISFYMAITTDHGDYVEGMMIIAIVIINAVLALVQENNAEKSLAALQSMNQQTTKVLREGQEQMIPSEELVVGDVILLEAGGVIPADARVLESIQLRVEESALTGESEAVEKHAEFTTDEELSLGDQQNMVFSGCLVANGRGRAIVTAIGMKTEMGKIAKLLNQEGSKKTPLQNRLDSLGKRVSLLALIAAAIVFIIGVYQNEPLLEMFMTAVSLAVAAVPETLMVIVTLTLSFGVQKMVKKHAIIRKLPAVETLGTANVICSDKTGTLTQNKMQVRRVWFRGDTVVDVEEAMTDEAMEVLKMAALCSNAKVEQVEEDSQQVVGNPTEVAIVSAVENNYHTKKEIEEKYPRVAELPFDSSRKVMTTVHKMGKKYISITKGAFDVMLPKFRFGDLEQATVVNDRFGKKALRVIAVGFRIFEEKPSAFTSEYLENEMNLMGLIGMIDPPRPESKGAIARAKRAGIKTVMITGDHVVTASAIAKELGILTHAKEAMSGAELHQITDEELTKRVKEYSVYARVTPEDKIRIVKAWQKTGAVVAMTGDGVNDAPALKASDVGCAMGIAGTDVAKSAADIVLTDDNFATIVDAVAEGRTVYKNIRKAVNFLLSCNISEIFVVLIAMLLGWGAPVIALQLLFVNVVADGLPGFALSREKAEEGAMKEKPIAKNQSIFGDGLWKWILFNSILFTIVTLTGYYLGSFVDGVSTTVGASHEVGQTMAFLILGYSSIVHIFNCRSSQSIFKVSLSSNKQLVEMAVLAIFIMTMVALLPPLQTIFSVVPLSMNHWRIIISFSLLPVLATELVKFHYSDTETED